jgi:glucans biosynthesis protein
VLGGLAALGAAAACPVAAGASADAAAWPAEVPLGPARPFSFEGLSREAAALAVRPYTAPPAAATGLAHAIDYDAFGKIAYHPSATLWGSAPGDRGVRFFPVGRPAPIPLAMHVVNGGLARQVTYSADLFDIPADSPLRRLDPAAAGFGGFRVMNADHTTDWLSFLGASYFRSADPFNQYGLSARGLAIDTATPRPESFPTFTAFWIERNPTGPLTIYALLEGPQVCGACKIVNDRSAAGLTQRIDLQLHFRQAIGRLGLAPLTSMYWYDQNDRTPADDWRPQIHDSGGLSIWTGAGERIWRPLADPPRVITSAFLDQHPRGFGLTQRDRDFGDYQDDGVFYERRPSAFVEPIGDWGRGVVQLVQIPTDGETNDNIVAFWTPARPVSPGQRLDVSYRLHWSVEEPTPVGVARVTATRSGRGGRPGQDVPAGRRKFVVDFEGGALAGLDRASGVEAVVETHPGAVFDVVCYPLAVARRWRLMFDVAADAGHTVELRAFLRRGGEALTETWLDQIVGPD